MPEKISSKTVLSYFDRPEVIEHYARATANVGLWNSEEIVFTKVFKKDDRLLEIGTGTGRIALALHEIGFLHVMGVDLSKAMIQRARRIAHVLEYPVPFQVMDVTKLKLDDGLFDGVIFGFNGLMQVPGRDRRRQALREIARVLRPGGRFVFTTHDRETREGPFWREEQKRWDNGSQREELLEFGDRFESTDLGDLYIHVPDTREVRADLKATDWRIEADFLRSHVANEPQIVREFSDECRFWVCSKPSTLADPAPANPPTTPA